MDGCLLGAPFFVLFSLYTVLISNFFRPGCKILIPSGI